MWSVGKTNGKVSRAVFLAAVNAAFLAVSANAQDLSGLPAQLLEKVEAARQACSDLDNGQFAVEFGAVHRVDLDGDLYSDWVLDEAGFACSTAASLYCGTGGCMTHFLVEDELHSLLNQGWDLVDLRSNRVLLAYVHGSQCGGTNPTPCATVSTWDTEEKRWRTTDAEWE